jgi:hypothetical protein
MNDGAGREDVVRIADNLHAVGPPLAAKLRLQAGGDLRAYAEDDRVGRPHDSPDVCPDPASVTEVLPGA